MSGDIGRWTKEILYESEKVPPRERKPLKKLEFEELIKKIGFYQR